MNEERGTLAAHGCHDRPVSAVPGTPQRYFGVRCGVWADVDHNVASTLGGTITQLWASCDTELSRFRPDSTLSLINDRAGTWVSAPDSILHLAAVALEARERSGGLFDPTVSVAALGYRCDFAALNTRSGGTLIETDHVAHRSGGGANVDVNAADRQVRVERGAALDLGGLAKGWIADETLRLLVASGAKRAFVDIGGDIALTGSWTVDVEDIDDKQRRVRWAQWSVSGGGVATSGTGYRSWEGPTGERYHHLVDPRTGRPAESNLRCVSAHASSAMHAEIASTVALVGNNTSLAEPFGAVAVALTAGGERAGWGSAAPWCSPT